MKRGLVQTSNSRLVSLWIPTQLKEALDKAVLREDSDRSKFLRNALRDRLEKFGVQVPDESKEETEATV